MKEQNGNGFAPSIAQAIEEMKAFQGDSFSLERINLAELERRTGVSRSRLRRLKRNGFQNLQTSTGRRWDGVTNRTGPTATLWKVRIKRFTKLYAENSCVWCRRILSDSIFVRKERSPLTAL